MQQDFLVVTLVQVLAGNAIFSYPPSNSLFPIRDAERFVEDDMELVIIRVSEYVMIEKIAARASPLVRSDVNIHSAP